MTPTPDIAELRSSAGWIATFAESGPDLPPLRVSVVHSAPDTWRITYEAGEEIIAKDGRIVLVDGKQQTVLDQGEALRLPVGLEMLGSPHVSVLERLLAQTLSTRLGSREGRDVWEMRLNDGSLFVLDRALLLGHLFCSRPGGLLAELSGIQFTQPPTAAFEIAGLPTADRAGLGRIHVTRSEGSHTTMEAPPMREFYLLGRLWAVEVGPTTRTFGAALQWCEQRAIATEVSVNGPHGREYFGVGSWAGSGFRTIPSWLAES